MMPCTGSRRPSPEIGLARDERFAFRAPPTTLRPRSTISGRHGRSPFQRPVSAASMQSRVDAEPRLRCP